MLVECPDQAYTVQRIAEVDVAFRRYNAFQTIFELCEGKAPVTTAVVHPCDRESLLGAFEAAAKGLIVPILVGPDAKIRAAAKDAGVNLDGVKVVATEHSHAAADRAFSMGRSPSTTRSARRPPGSSRSILRSPAIPTFSSFPIWKPATCSRRRLRISRRRKAPASCLGHACRSS